MATVGLVPDCKISPDDPEMAIIEISKLVEYAFRLRMKLDAINENSYNNFTLRIGEMKTFNMDARTSNLNHFFVVLSMFKYLKKT